MGCLRDGALQAKAPSLWQAVARLMLVLFGIMSLAHEMLYQRVLWLMLGLALAITRAKANQSCAD